MSSGSNWFAIRKELTPSQSTFLTGLSFLLPVLLWCAVSYVPWIWHPMVEIQNKGDVSYFREGRLVKKDVFQRENNKMLEAGKTLALGKPANPIYLPPPHQVAKAMYTGFTTKPRRKGEPWLHESLLHSAKIIFWGFTLSSLIGVPLGILAGCYSFFKKLFEPFIEFFRYLPAPAFGALAVAILGIYDAPKVSIIFIGTFFQQVLVISNTTSKLEVSLIEAAQTLGANRIQMLTRVVIPGILPNLYKDLRILLGWAWTYLIVAEIVGTSTGITWFINQQAKYRIYENVYAAIFMIGFIGLATDLILGWIGDRLFPWENARKGTQEGVLSRMFSSITKYLRSLTSKTASS
ncbi:ABC transporter permease subunit [Puniceicoccaceae bacterium K14]|nr:ABC transporter permease subunit [Puniceicoccaceae bacterium K14]